MSSTRMRRASAAVLAAIVVLVPFTGPRAQSAGATAPTEGVIAQGAGLSAAAVAVGNIDPDLDVWPLYSESSMDNQTSHGLSGAIWPGFLLDAFAWLYGLQPQERAGMGISESQWPNPPYDSHASSSEFMIDNFHNGCSGSFDPQQCAQAFDAFGDSPLNIGSSESHSGRGASSGFSRGASFDIPGILEATEARSRTNSRYMDGKTVVEAVFTMRDVTIGSDVHIDLVEARSTAKAAGSRAASEGTSTLRIVGATFGGEPIEIDDQGMHVQGDGGTDDLNEQLASQGIEVRASQGRNREDSTGESVDTATGGLLVRISRDRVEEDIPTPLVEGKNAMCSAAEDNPLRQEITRVRVDQPNPLYGQVPVPGVPERAQVEQSVPPPLSCPFTNRNFEITLVLGLTNASARKSALPPFEFGAAGTPFAPTVDGGTVRASTNRTGLAQIYTVPSMAAPSEQREAVLASAPSPNPNLPRSVRIFYGVLLLLVGGAIAGRFAFRAVSAP